MKGILLRPALIAIPASLVWSIGMPLVWGHGYPAFGTMLNLQATLIFAVIVFSLMVLVEHFFRHRN